MTTTEKEALLAKRKGLIDDAKATLDLSREATGGEPTAEALDEFNKQMDGADAIRVQLENYEKNAERASAAKQRLESAEATLRAGIGRTTRALATVPNELTPEAAGLIMEMSGHRYDLSGDAVMVKRSTNSYREAFGQFLQNSKHPGAAMTLDTASEGGVLAPTTFVMQMIKELNAQFLFRQLATVIPQSGTQTREVEFPRRTTRLAKLTKGQVWTSGGTDPALGTMKMTLHPWTGEAQVNKALMMFSPFNVEAFIRSEINYDKQSTQEQLFMTGTGVLEPFGLFVANAIGLPTSADVTTTISWDGIVNFKMELRDVYLNSSTTRVISHRNFQKALMKVRTTDGVPLFQPSLRVGEPDTMLGVPMLFSEFAPAGTNGVYVSGQYPAVIGDLKNYWIFESMNLAIEQHDLDIRSNLNSYLYRIWFDGGIRMAEAFKRLKIT